MKNSILFIGALLLCGLLYQCTELSSDLNNSDLNENDYEIELRDDSSDVASAVSIMNSLDTPEIVNNEIVKFRDSTHFFTYYEDLNDIYGYSDSIFKEAIVTSESFETVYNKLSTDEFANPQNRYQPFLGDPIMQAIVNQYFEFQVDDALVTYLNNRDVVISDINNSSARLEIRSITKGQDIDSTDIPDNVYWGDDHSRRSFYGGWCGCEINIRILDCNNARVWGNCRNFWNNDGEGDIDICYTQAQSPSWSLCDHYEVDGNFSFDIELTGSGTYYINARALSNCQFDDYAFQEVDPSLSYCDYNERQTDGWEQSPSQAIYTRTSYYKNWLGVPYHEAKVSAYYKDNDGIWYGHEADKLTTTIDASAGNLDCVNKTNKRETEICYNCPDESVRVNVLGWAVFNPKIPVHCDGDVFGEYNKLEGPTSVTGKHFIDFDCCQ